MARYAIANPAANGADAGEAIFALWNPSGSIALRVTDLRYEVNTGAAAMAVHRTSTKGTPNGTTTPDADNAFNRRAAPPSGAVLDRGNFTVAPTLEQPPLFRFRLQSSAGSAVHYWFPVPIVVPPGTGLAVAVDAAVTAHNCSFAWEE